MTHSLSTSSLLLLSQKMTSTPGQILLSGIVVLAKPRPVDPSKGNRNIAFDVNLPVDDGAEHQTLGLLRYFIPESRINDLERVWQDDFTQAFIISKVCLRLFLDIFFLDPLSISLPRSRLCLTPVSLQH